jgi:hypothetical protein
MAKRVWTAKNLHGMMTCVSWTLSKYVIGKTKVVLQSEKQIYSPLEPTYYRRLTIQIIKLRIPRATAYVKAD